MKLITVILFIFIFHEIIASYQESIHKRVGRESECKDKIALRKPLTLRANNSKGSGPIRTKKQNTSKNNNRYQPYQKKKPILSVPPNLRKPDSETISKFYNLSDTNRGVNSLVLDYCVTEIVDRYKRFGKDWIYIPQELGSNIMHYDSSDTLYNMVNGIGLKKFKNGTFKGKTIVVTFAIYNDRHSVCLIADMNRKTIEYYNPSSPRVHNDFFYKEANKYYRFFLDALKRRNRKVKEQIDVTGWRLIRPRFKNQPQVDHVNCSIYCIMYIDGRMNVGKRVINSNDVFKVRDALYKAFILKISKKP